MLIPPILKMKKIYNPHQKENQMTFTKPDVRLLACLSMDADRMTDTEKLIVANARLHTIGLLFAEAKCWVNLQTEILQTLGITEWVTAETPKPTPPDAPQSGYNAVDRVFTPKPLPMCTPKGKTPSAAPNERSHR